MRILCEEHNSSTINYPENKRKTIVRWSTVGDGLGFDKEFKSVGKSYENLSLGSRFARCWIVAGKRHREVAGGSG